MLEALATVTAALVHDKPRRPDSDEPVQVRLRAGRLLARTPDQVASLIAARPYDLRHAAVSLWLNAGIPAPTVARRAGHSVDVLLRMYANCIDGDGGIANGRISDPLS